ncbi:hypothetical protein [Microlunatus sp. Gsoil 973]|uniref:hypothetical protein n=1 Tax=Microlunatus sp. Gsoil 973 TaxID=2672569 RepID=UPI0012B4E1EB|nr:hypothetical protein [Microlunatus sp. Gsoil 973]QGN35213.1 hypothetical protein GJV80_22930 [Microlunatus sp. Gsoil 973]
MSPSVRMVCREPNGASGSAERGTPEIAEFAPVELGPVLGMPEWQARALVADSIDLRYRLPRLWELVLAGRIHGWRARRIAQRTRELSLDAAAGVDAEVWECVESMPWQRFSDLLESRILLADPDRAIRLAEKASRGRHVSVSKRPRYGTKTVIMRLDAADANQLEDSIDRTARVLRSSARSGDQLPGVVDRQCASEQEFRAQAAGLMAQPLVAAAVMAHDSRRSDQRVEIDAETRRPVVTPAVEDQLTGPVPEWLARADLSKLAPRAVLHVHVSAESLRAGSGICRVEGIGPVILDQARCWLGSGVRVKLQPVIDASDLTAVDAYEVPSRMREALLARSPASCFPWSTVVSRRIDVDHTIPYQKGPPGQTWLGNLGPLSRTEHRVRTHGGWQVRQPVPGTYVWRSTYGYVLLVNRSGTHALGNSDFAEQVWSSAADIGPVERRFREFIRDFADDRSTAQTRSDPQR